ncbi:MAG: cell division protein FtsQ [Bacteroidales bacterium OttesenSCG-928-I14]|jgi:cell division protein FtsQ|nr:cell division protein FtsQ [Bacteroidales bacterium OttesenSCG-928-I14]
MVKNDKFLYVRKYHVYSYLDRFGINPLKKNISDVKTEVIEKTLRKCELIKKVIVYKTVDCSIRIKIYQRTPILRIITDKIDCYIDSEKNIFPAMVGLVVYVPLASGMINNFRYVREQLYPLAVFLLKNEFWNSQIEQIYVNNDLEMELIPLVGTHRILLGGVENFEKKLNNLEFFYKKILNKIGWNRYSIINLKYNNQVICTKAN